MFISHDLSVVSHISDRVAVMFLGRIVEVAPAEKLYKNPLHPYTQVLLEAVPVPDPSIQTAEISILEEMLSPISPPPGCPFHPRCPQALPVCSEKEPSFINVATGSSVCCHLY